MRRIRRKFTRRERHSTVVGIGISALIAWWAYAPVAARLDQEFGTAKPKKTVQAKSEGPVLTSPGMVAAINAAKPFVAKCYVAYFGHSRHLEQVVIVEFWAEIAGGKGVVFDGKVPVADSISQEFDGCIQEQLYQASFETSLPPGRQKITFPFVFWGLFQVSGTLRCVITD